MSNLEQLHTALLVLDRLGDTFSVDTARQHENIRLSPFMSPFLCGDDILISGRDNVHTRLARVVGGPLLTVEVTASENATRTLFRRHTNFRAALDYVARNLDEERRIRENNARVREDEMRARHAARIAHENHVLELILAPTAPPPALTAQVPDEEVQVLRQAATAEELVVPTSLLDQLYEKYV